MCPPQLAVEHPFLLNPSVVMSLWSPSPSPTTDFEDLGLTLEQDNALESRLAHEEALSNFQAAVAAEEERRLLKAQPLFVDNGATTVNREHGIYCSMQRIVVSTRNELGNGIA